MSTPDDRISALSDDKAVGVLEQVVQVWLEHRPIEASNAVFASTLGAPEALASLPSWVVNPSESQSDAGRLARAELLAIAHADDDEAIGWVIEALDRADEVSAQVVVVIPAVVVVGKLLIGAILASES